MAPERKVFNQKEAEAFWAKKKLIARNNFVKSWLYFGFGFSKKFGLKRGQREIVADQKVFCVVSKVVRYRAVVVLLRY